MTWHLHNVDRRRGTLRRRKKEIFKYQKENFPLETKIKLSESYFQNHIMGDNYHHVSARHSSSTLPHPLFLQITSNNVIHSHENLLNCLVSEMRNVHTEIKLTRNKATFSIERKMIDAPYIIIIIILKFHTPQSKIRPLFFLFLLKKLINFFLVFTHLFINWKESFHVLIFILDHSNKLRLLSDHCCCFKRVQIFHNESYFFSCMIFDDNSWCKNHFFMSLHFKSHF